FWIVLPTLAGLLFFSSMLVIRDVRNLQEARTLIQFNSIVTTLSTLIEEITAERANAFNFLDSKGVKAAQEMPQQFPKTDIPVKQVREAVAQLNRGALPAVMNGKIDALLKALDRMPEVRDLTQKQGIPANDALTYYRGVGALSLDVIDQT